MTAENDETTTAQMRARYKELKKELEEGQRQLEALENQRSGIQHTLLRISGAIQVLEELGVSGGEDAAGGDS